MQTSGVTVVEGAEEVHRVTHWVVSFPQTGLLALACRAMPAPAPFTRSAQCVCAGSAAPSAAFPPCYGAACCGRVAIEQPS
nr:unnamed protein product [Digitaria exilis]